MWALHPHVCAHMCTCVQPRGPLRADVTPGAGKARTRHYLSCADDLDPTLSVCAHAHACESVCAFPFALHQMSAESSLFSQHSRPTHTVTRPNHLSAPALLTGLVGNGEFLVGGTVKPLGPRLVSWGSLW